jgi:glucose/arabinose dehydrogenase
MRVLPIALLLLLSTFSVGCLSANDSDDGFDWPDPSENRCNLDIDALQELAELREGVELGDSVSLDCDLFIEGFDAPHHSLINPSNGDLWIVYLSGFIKSWDGGNLEDVADLSSLVSRCHMEQGLLGLAFTDDPNMVLLSYVEDGVCEGENQSDLILSYATVDEDNGKIDAENITVLKRIEQPNRNHNGGFLLHAGDGSFLWGIGDGGGANDPDSNGQDNSTELGTILFFELENGGLVPAINDSSENPLILHHGLRNPWRFDLDTEGRLWIADVGQNCWEEVNLVTIDEKANLGWAEREGFQTFYEGASCSEVADMADPNYVDPVFAYPHQNGNCSITGGYWMDWGPEVLQEGYLYGDFCTGAIWLLKESHEESVWEETLVGYSGGMIVGFGEGPEGGLLVFHWTGEILRIS